MTPRRIGHLIKGLGRGGAESLLPQTIRAGGGEFVYEVGYFLPWKDALVEEIERLGSPVTCFSARSAGGMLARVLWVARWIRERQIDLLHCHLPLAGLVGRLAGKMAGVPVVYTEHNLQERYHPWTRRANRWTWGLQHVVVAVSGEVARSIRENMGDTVPVEVVHNGIEVERMTAPPEAGLAVRERLRIPADAPVVGTVAVFRKQKRLDLWLEIARRVLDSVPEAHFILVGDGPVRGALEEIQASLGLNERAHLPGLQSDTLPYLAAMDLFLISSEFEGLPLVLLEAMAFGLPVVATEVGGIPEVIDRSTGVTVMFGSVEAGASAVAKLLTNPAYAATLAQNSKQHILQTHGVERMVAKLEELYAGTI